MLDNVLHLSSHDYEIKLDTIVRAVCEISIDIGKQLEELIELRDSNKGFTALDLFDDEVLLEMSIRPEEILDRYDEKSKKTIEGIKEEGLIGKITSFLNKTITKSPSFEDALKANDDILLLDRKSTRFYSKGEGGKERLLKAIKRTKVLKILISRLKDDKIRKSLDKLEVFENDIFYRNVIESSRLVGDASATVIPANWLIEDGIEKRPIERNNIWINERFYKKFDKHFKICDELFNLVDTKNDSQIGLLVGNHLCPYVKVDISKYIKDNFLLEYFFDTLKMTYTKKRVERREVHKELVQRFIDSAQEPELNRVLSHLKNNFYIENSLAIDDQYKDFFNSVISFKELELLEDYHFLLSSSIEQETALGIYSNTKKQNEYNLIHWMNHDGESKVDHYRKITPSSRTKQLVSTLKPAICYYFVHKYFEDFVETILKHNGNQFFSNHKISIDRKEFTEIDFFVKSSKKLIYVEAKTKLTKFNIDSFVKRSSQLIEKFKIITNREVEIEFVLLGCFSDSSVSDYQYFIDENTEYENYNKTREDLNCIPYYFKVPIPDKENKTVTCIAEPEFDKLKVLLKDLWPI